MANITLWTWLRWMAIMLPIYAVHIADNTKWEIPAAIITGFASYLLYAYFSVKEVKFNA